MAFELFLIICATLVIKPEFPRDPSNATECRLGAKWNKRLKTRTLIWRRKYLRIFIFKKCYLRFKHTLNEPSSDYAQRWGGNNGNVQNSLNTAVLADSFLQNRLSYFLRTSKSSFAEHKNVWSSFRLIWHSEDRASWYILTIKPMRCNDFSNLIKEFIEVLKPNLNKKKKLQVVILLEYSVFCFLCAKFQAQTPKEHTHTHSCATTSGLKHDSSYTKIKMVPQNLL